MPRFDAHETARRDVHLLGLVSEGGVHSHVDHLRALLRLAEQEGMAERTWIHAFTDGRDVSPHAGERDLAALPTERIATVCGRYYAMDRDERWDRTDRALAAIVRGEGTVAADPVQAVRDSYERGVTDEFVEPVVVSGRPRLGARDAAVFFNFRPDRARQLSQRLLEEDVDLTTMTRYREDFPCPVVFDEQLVRDTLAEVLAANGVRQLHAAETEKYAHVTYFLNGGEEREWEGEERILVPSPRDVPSYDLKPEMSADEVAARFCGAMGEGFGFGVVNFANPDMVGHTGSIPAVIAAVEATDRALGRVVECVHTAGGVCLVTADHGNAEVMLASDGMSPHTAHTTNPVPLVVTDEAFSPAKRRRTIRSRTHDPRPARAGCTRCHDRGATRNGRLTTPDSSLYISRPILAAPMSLPQPDPGVLRKAQRGDERAFSIIVRTYEQPVFNYVLRLTGDRALSEDLTQEVFLRVYQGLSSFSLRSRFTTWLFQVTKNRVLDELRAIERRPRSVVNIEDAPPLEVVDAPAERAETIDAVWRAVEALNPDLKMALLLRDVVGLSYTEIAESLEITLATVKWRIYKAREEVQLALQRDGVVIPITAAPSAKTR